MEEEEEEEQKVGRTLSWSVEREAYLLVGLKVGSLLATRAHCPFGTAWVK